MDLKELLNSEATEAEFRFILADIRWSDKPVCPYCNDDKSYKRGASNGYKCRSCNSSFTVTTGTLFHATKIPLRKWFAAIQLVVNAAKGISSLQLARTIGVNKNTAWYMQYRIREGMKGEELFSALRQKFGDSRAIINKSRRHRDRLRLATGEKGVKRREPRHVKSPPSARNKLLLNRAIQGQYHQLSDFHLGNYDNQLTFIRTFYKPFVVRSLLTGMCAVM